MTTVIVVALGDDPRLATCLEAVARAGPPDPELVVVENGAVGPPPELPLRPAVRLRRPENPGFAAAVNEALAASQGQSVLTLNPDVQLEPGSFAAARAALESDPDVAGVAFRLLRPDKRTLDGAGIRLGPVRRARDRGMGRPAAGRHLEREPVDGACMAAALLRRSALEAARDGAGEVLDSRFFAYKEDVELCWRLRRAGFRILYEPRAVALHERGWREGGRRAVPLDLRRASLRNRWWTIAKNESVLGFVLRLPLYVGFEALIWLYLLLREPRALAFAGAAVRGLPESFRRRRRGGGRWAG